MTNVIREDISKEKLMEILSLKNKALGMGGYGIVNPYDRKTLIKIYYSEIYNTYSSLDKDVLDEEIAMNLIMKERDSDRGESFNRSEQLIKLCESLSKTSSKDLIKGIVFYNNYAIGVLMTWYKKYVTLSSVFDKLSLRERITVLERAKFMLEELMNSGIYPCDIGEENILINPKKLDVKIIDLDDPLTKIEALEIDDYITYAKYDCDSAFSNMKKRLTKRR